MTPLLVVSPSAKAGGRSERSPSLVRHLPTFGFRPVVALLERAPLERWLAEAGCEVAPVQDRGSAATTARLHGLALTIGAEIVLSNKRQGHFLGGPAAAAEEVPRRLVAAGPGSEKRQGGPDRRDPPRRAPLDDRGT